MNGGSPSDFGRRSSHRGLNSCVPRDVARTVADAPMCAGGDTVGAPRPSPGAPATPESTAGSNRARRGPRRAAEHSGWLEAARSAARMAGTVYGRKGETLAALQPLVSRPANARYAGSWSGKANGTSWPLAGTAGAASIAASRSCRTARAGPRRVTAANDSEIETPSVRAGRQEQRFPPPAGSRDASQPRGVDAAEVENTMSATVERKAQATPQRRFLSVTRAGAGSYRRPPSAIAAAARNSSARGRPLVRDVAYACAERATTRARPGVTRAVAFRVSTTSGACATTSS